MQVTVHRVRSITSEITHYTDPPAFFVRTLKIVSEDGSYELKLMASSQDFLIDQQQVVKYEPKRDERTWIERFDAVTPAPDDAEYDDDIDNDPDDDDDEDDDDIDDDDDADIGEPVGSTQAVS